MKTKRNKQAQQRRRTTLAASRSAKQTQLFAEHLRELRRRISYVAISVIGWATAAYFVQQHIVSFLLKPAGHQQFIYTSPGGGMNFLVSVCLNTGIVLSIPVIVYNLLKFIEPLLHASSMKFIRRMSAAAALLALGGMAFGYYLGLPHTLHFLTNQFQTNQIHALIAIQSYMAFVTKFLAGSALIFQAPLILLIINRIRPLGPRSLLKYERWVILASCILGGLLSPTPDIRPMLLLSLPMIVMYQVGIVLIWQLNRRGRKPAKILALLEQDALQQAERLRQAQNAFMMPLRTPQFVLVPVGEEQPVSLETPADQTEAAPTTSIAILQAAQPPVRRSPLDRGNYQALSGRPIRRRLIM